MGHLIILVVVFLMSTAPANAQPFHTCTRPDGRKVLTNEPCPGEDRYTPLPQRVPRERASEIPGSGAAEQKKTNIEEERTEQRQQEHVPQGGPSRAVMEPPPGPCAKKPWDPTNVHHARETYKAALAKLKLAPHDLECREQALRFGRLYMGMSRQDGRVTIYDEAAIANDINAIAGVR